MSMMIRTDKEDKITMIVTMTMLIKVAFAADNLLYNVYSHTFIKFIAVLGSLNLDSKGS